MAASEAPPTTPAPLEPAEFHESFDAKLDVAGDVRKGILASDPDSPVDLEHLRVWLPEQAIAPAHERTLCLEIDSQDGAYHARIAFELESETGMVPLRITDTREGRTQFAEQLARYDAGQLGVLAYLAESPTGPDVPDPGCPARADRYLAVSWGPEVEKPSRLVLQINAHDMQTLLSDSADEPLGECAAVEDRRSARTFDTLCTVEVDDRIESLRVRLKKFRTIDEPIALPIALPGR